MSLLDLAHTKDMTVAELVLGVKEANAAIYKIIAREANGNPRYAVIVLIGNETTADVLANVEALEKTWDNEISIHIEDSIDTQLYENDTVESARQLYDEFLQRQKHFRPEDRLSFVQRFLARYCDACGGMLTNTVCLHCSQKETPCQKESSCQK